jgi:hypothetical protein
MSPLFYDVLCVFLGGSARFLVCGKCPLDIFLPFNYASLFPLRGKGHFGDFDSLLGHCYYQYRLRLVYDQ